MDSGDHVHAPKHGLELAASHRVQRLDLGPLPKRLRPLLPDSPVVSTISRQPLIVRDCEQDRVSHDAHSDSIHLGGGGRTGRRR